jgi:predicted DsbA family dithiol-disulfide isomerase
MSLRNPSPNDQPDGRIDVISDAICPWCYIGKRQLESALTQLRDEGLTFSVHWHPYQLNPTMPEAGTDRAAYRLAKFGSKERSDQLEARVIEAAAAVGLNFRTDLIARVPNTLAAHRLILLAGRHGVQDAVVERLFSAYFIEGQDIGDPATLSACAAEAGLDRALVTNFLASDDGRAEVLAEDESARRAGIDGVPSFAINAHVIFSGAMPAETMAEAFRRAWGILKARAA